MILGPVFRSELMRTARRGRYYILRFVYGALLLALFWSAYEETFGGARTAKIAAVAQFAEGTFLVFALVQVVTVMVLIPPLFGGAIADEKQKKTLHYLMASQLSSGEIVADKMLGRLPHLVVFTAMGLPVVSILGLVGGVPVEYLVVAFVGTASTATFAAALTVLVSTLARGVRQSVLTAYVLLLTWLFVPTFIDVTGSRLYPMAYHWISAANEWLVASSPFGAFVLIMQGGGRGPFFRISPTLVAFQWMVGIQLAAAALFLVLAAWGLRPAFRRQEETPARRTWFRGAGGSGPRRRWFARPECGADAVLWKERYFAPTDIFTRLVLLPAIVIVTLPLALITEVQVSFGQVANEFWRNGPKAINWMSDNLVWALRLDIGWYTALWLLAVAGASASSVTLEHEEDTWVSLTATPLTGWQILRAKAIGAIWNQRGFAAVMVLLWEMASLSVVPAPNVLASVALVGLLTWLVAAVGVHASLRATNTSRAIAATIATLFFLNGYPILLFLGFRGELSWDSSFNLLGFMPRLAAAPLMKTSFGAAPWWSSAAQSRPFADPLTFVPMGRLWLIGFYIGTASLLTWRSVARFDRWLDRPKLLAPLARQNWYHSKFTKPKELDDVA
jgi:ABC-type transport system involved in multi-copper enzyme maturation permease subunit